jgi:hypothetical protein
VLADWRILTTKTWYEGYGNSFAIRSSYLDLIFLLLRNPEVSAERIKLAVVSYRGREERLMSISHPEVRGLNDSDLEEGISERRKSLGPLLYSQSSLSLHANCRAHYHDFESPQLVIPVVAPRRTASLEV